MAEIAEDTGRLINVLPESLANKIAAGEVVQRPASVLKEVVENAIDAGAGRIEVTIKSAGSELVQVVDDGCGMGREDALMSFRRHATSKISSDDDLLAIYTLGFRGEALASIAAVAQVELRTRRHADAAGTLVRVAGGAEPEIEPAAAPPGTSVSVRNLFFNVPARRNFLKTPATEFKHLVETFQFLAVSNPNIAFSFSHDGHEIYRLSRSERDAATALRQRVGELFGTKHLESLVPVREETSYLTLSGFVGRPEFNRKSRGEQFLFINGRYVTNRYLDHAITSAYADMLPKGSFPFYVLFLTLDPQHVDVNVHPTKAEVKFDDERGVYGFFRTVIKRSLGVADITPDVGYDGRGRLVDRDATSVEGSVFKPGRTDRGFSDVERGGSGAGSGHSFRNPLRDYYRPSPQQRDIFAGSGESLEALFGGKKDDAGSEPQTGLVVQSAKDDSSESVADNVLWQLHEKYILSRIRSGLMIVDQHAAHERILYERGLKAMESGFGLSQQLLFPYTVEMSASNLELLKELRADLQSLGFDIEMFSGRSVVVRGVPADIHVGNERSILEEIMEQYKDYRDSLQIKGRDNLAKSLACRSAIKTGRKLAVTEMRALIDQLFACDMPYACPHGRPTMIKISIDELDKRFGRIGHLERS